MEYLMLQQPQTFKPVLSYPDKIIGLLYLQINQQSTLLQQIKAVLPSNLRDHALHCVLKNKKLLLYTDSASWASQLRFYGKAIQSVFEPEASIPFEVQVKVIEIPTNALADPSRKTNTPSQTVADEINKYSHRITDPQLKNALSKLSDTLSRLNTQRE
jgi:hypothetical protein